MDNLPHPKGLFEWTPRLPEKLVKGRIVFQKLADQAFMVNDFELLFQ